tara:strand:+ start:899 stop:1009 length:111 start_codon:yes stop_codon:yes gene_type:complete
MKVDKISILSGIFFCFTFIPVVMVMTGTALTILGIL